MKIAVAQISCALGDLHANLVKIGNFSSQAQKTGAELIVFPELASIRDAAAFIKCLLCELADAFARRKKKLGNIPVIRGSFVAVEIFDAGAGVENDDALAAADLTGSAQRFQSGEACSAFRSEE